MLNDKIALLINKKIFKSDKLACIEVLFTDSNYSNMRIFYQHLINKGKPGKIAVIATMRKLLLVLNSVMKRQTPWIQKLESFA